MSAEEPSHTQVSFLEDRTRQLLVASRDGDIERIVNALQNILETEIGLFDVFGNVMAQSVVRSIWDWNLVLRGRGQAELCGETNEFPIVREVISGGEVIALLAAKSLTQNRTLLDTAADLIGLALVALRARQEGRRELAVNVIENIVSRLVNDRDAMQQMHSIGLDPQRQHRVLLGSSETRTSRLMNVPWNIHSLMARQADPFVRILFRGRLLMVVPEDSMDGRIGTTLLEHLANVGKDSRVGISLPQAGPAGIRAGYIEALAALQQGEGIQHAGFLDLAKVMVAGNTTTPLPEVIVNVLGPLLEYDQKHGGELIHTLRIFLQLDRNMNASAEALFVHRNTLRYRLQKIRDLLKIDLNRSVSISTLWIALEALEDRESQ